MQFTNRLSRWPRPFQSTANPENFSWMNFRRMVNKASAKPVVIFWITPWLGTRSGLLRIVHWAWYQSTEPCLLFNWNPLPSQTVDTLPTKKPTLFQIRRPRPQDLRRIKRQSLPLLHRKLQVKPVCTVAATWLTTSTTWKHLLHNPLVQVCHSWPHYRIVEIISDHFITRYCARRKHQHRTMRLRQWTQEYTNFKEEKQKMSP